MVGLLVPRSLTGSTVFRLLRDAALPADSIPVFKGHSKKTRIQKPQDVDGLLGRIHDFETSF